MDTKKKIVEAIHKVVKRFPETLPIKMRRGWENSQGFEYDLLDRIEDSKSFPDGLYLFDSANGTNNPTVCPLQNLTASQLSNLLNRCLDCASAFLAENYQHKSHNDYHWTARWAMDAHWLACFRSNNKFANPYATACSYIRKCLQKVDERMKATDGEAFLFKKSPESLPLYPYTVKRLVPANIIIDEAESITGILKTIRKPSNAKDNRPVKGFVAMNKNNNRIMVTDNNLFVQGTPAVTVPDDSVYLLEMWLDANLPETPSPQKKRKQGH